MKQLSDCCKAEIKLTGKDRPNAFSCSKCGRIIGTPVTKSQTEGKKRKLIEYFLPILGVLYLIAFIINLNKCGLMFCH